MKLVKNAVICVENEENSKIIFLLFLSFILYGNKCDKENKVYLFIILYYKLFNTWVKKQKLYFDIIEWSCLRKLPKHAEGGGGGHSI